MALNVICSKGHSYIQADVYPNWPLGAPHCPQCYQEWLKTDEGKKWQREASPKRKHPSTLGIGISEGVTTQDRLR